MSLRVFDEFCGFGGSSQGLAAVPGLELAVAANHAPRAVEVHGLNFPAAEHILGDVTGKRIETFPAVEFFWASPACPPWSNARGRRRDFDTSTQGVLFGPEGPDPETGRRRALMEEVVRYLRAVNRRGRPVLGGVVENVVECHRWDQFARWRREIEAEGYTTRLIALNSMHAQPLTSTRAPQSRDRLYLAYVHKSIGRVPDWDRWLRPTAWCPTCDQVVNALQVFKNPGQVMGRYGLNGQYYYRCPNRSCRHQIIHPQVLPAAVAVDLSLPTGAKIGERVDKKGRPDPLKPATWQRIADGLVSLAGRGMLAPAGGTWRESATGLGVPMPTRTTRETDGLVLPPMLVPTTARERHAYPVGEPFRTQTTRQETALVTAPWLASLRGGGSRAFARPMDEPLATFSASGTHHALIGAPAHPADASPDQHVDRGRDEDSEAFLVGYYRTGRAHPLTEPVGTLTTRDRYAVINPGNLPAVEDCTFRMLTPPEIARGMAFNHDYQVTGTKRERVAGYGNAVTPPVAEILGRALVETITGEATS